MFDRSDGEAWRERCFARTEWRSREVVDLVRRSIVFDAEANASVTIAYRSITEEGGRRGRVVVTGAVIDVVDLFLRFNAPHSILAPDKRTGVRPNHMSVMDFTSSRLRDYECKLVMNVLSTGVVCSNNTCKIFLCPMSCRVS